MQLDIGITRRRSSRRHTAGFRSVVKVCRRPYPHHDRTNSCSRTLIVWKQSLVPRSKDLLCWELERVKGFNCPHTAPMHISLFVLSIGYVLVSHCQQARYVHQFVHQYGWAWSTPLPHVYIHRQKHRSVFDTVNHYQLSFRTIEWDSFAYRLRDSPEQQSCTSYTGPCETNCMVWSAAPLGRRNRIWICVIQFHTQNIVARREHDNRCCERRTTLFIRWRGCLMKLLED